MYHVVFTRLKLPCFLVFTIFEDVHLEIDEDHGVKGRSDARILGALTWKAMRACTDICDYIQHLRPGHAGEDTKLCPELHAGTAAAERRCGSYQHILCYKTNVCSECPLTRDRLPIHDSTTPNLSASC
jgi:hypothetical protein